VGTAGAPPPNRGHATTKTATAPSAARRAKLSHRILMQSIGATAASLAPLEKHLVAIVGRRLETDDGR
jgi:hypothetical protein